MNKRQIKKFNKKFGAKTYKKVAYKRLLHTIEAHIGRELRSNDIVNIITTRKGNIDKIAVFLNTSIAENNIETDSDIEFQCGDYCNTITDPPILTMLDYIDNWKKGLEAGGIE